MYVALGDSYAAGVGAGDRHDACFRSPLGYPPLLAEHLGIDLSYQACEGATIGDVRANQLAALDSSTSLVTVTVGGNDAGFVDVIAEVAAPSWIGNSTAAMDDAEEFIRTKLPTLLTSLYDDIRATAPQADLVVVGYPRLFASLDCNLLTFFSVKEMTRLNRLADQLDRVIATAASQSGADHVDVRAAFDGHAICQPGSWINGLTWPIDESFHPKASGHAAYARTIGDHLGEPAPTERAPDISYGPCIPGSAPRFAMKDLLAPAALAAAREHGLDPSEITDLVARLERWARPPQERMAATGDELAARRRLDELDRQVSGE